MEFAKNKLHESDVIELIEVLDQDVVDNYAVVRNDELRQFSNFNDKVRCPVLDNPDCADIADQTNNAAGTTRCNRQQYFDKVDVYLDKCEEDQAQAALTRPWSIEAQLGKIVGTWARDCANQSPKSFFGSYCDDTWPATCFKGVRRRTRQCCGDQSDSASAFYCAEAFDATGTRISQTCPNTDGEPSAAAQKIYWEHHIDYVNENTANSQSAAPGGEYTLPDCLWASWEPWSSPCEYLAYDMSTFEPTAAELTANSLATVTYTYDPTQGDELVRRQSDNDDGYKIAGQTPGYLNDEANDRTHTWYGYSAYLLNPGNWLDDPDRVEDDGAGGTTAHDGKPNWDRATPLQVQADKVFRESSSTHLMEFKVLKKRVRFCREQLCPGPTPQERKDSTEYKYKCNEEIPLSYETIDGVTYCRVMEEATLESCPINVCVLNLPQEVRFGKSYAEALEECQNIEGIQGTNDFSQPEPPTTT